MSGRNILVIRLGALGDMVMSFGPFAAIRAHHPDDRITLLTTAPFAGLMRAAPWFDRVEVDARPSWWNIPAVLRLRGQLRGHDMVYDLQTSSRSSRYFSLAGRPAWSGIARGASLAHANPGRNALHTIDRQRDQLEHAGIHDFPLPELGWLRATPLPPPVEAALPGRFALLVPGAAPHRPAKRWPVGHFGALARVLQGRGLAPVVVGAGNDAPLAAAIREACPAALDLTGRTNLPQLAAVASRAALAVGNDTGPMHVAAAMGCPGLVLFSADSDPALTAPRGPGPSGARLVRVLRQDVLADLPVERVAAALP